MPVGGIVPGEGPPDPGQREPLIYVAIAIDVGVVVKTDESVPGGLREGQCDGRDQRGANCRVDGDWVAGNGLAVAAAVAGSLASYPMYPHLQPVDVLAGRDEQRLHVLAAETDVAGPRLVYVDVLDLPALRSKTVTPFPVK